MTGEKSGTWPGINLPENVYAQSLTLNGKAVDRAWLTHEEIAAGGTLEFEMGAEPNKAWGRPGL